MRILLAEHLGMCFGVRDAIAMAHAVPDPGTVTVHGELVHNEQVLSELERRGLTMTAEADRGIPSSPRVLITAHGISDRERGTLLAAGKSLVDTTCPLVRRVHLAARRLAARGYFVVVVGRKQHVEVRGIVGDLAEHAVVESERDVATWPAAKIGMVCQTTTPPATALRLRMAISDANPHAEVRFVDTICAPTRARQKAVSDLLDHVDALVVVGGRSSNNTRQLAALAESRGVPSLQVTGADDLDPAWCRRYETLGLTAGTSTPDETVAAVHAALQEISGARSAAEQSVMRRGDPAAQPGEAALLVQRLGGERPFRPFS